MSNPEHTPKKSKTKVLISAVALLLVAGGLSVFLIRRKSSNPTRPPVELESVIHLQPFVVNLADPDQRTYLRIAVDLGINSAAENKKTENNTTPIVRDALLEVLTSIRSDELTTPEDKHRLKKTILQKLNERAPSLRAREVYFTEFLIQK